MNDPGIDKPIEDAAQDLEQNPYEKQQKLEEEEEEDFLDPTRWWFASTACPLIAGTFGPMANAFSICALVQPWREYIDVAGGQNEAQGSDITDPKWLIGINALSLVLALIANVALLLNMARRLSFEIAQPITIVGWFLSSFMLIGLVAFANTDHFRLYPRDQHALTQAFYYAIIAAGLYCIISMFMILTVYGAYRGHYLKEFKLTVSQRTLMLQTIAFMCYLLIGATIFKYVEGWKYLDAVYWADFTLLTVGIGVPFTPVTHLGRSLLFPYAIGGIVTLGLVVGSIRTLVLERGKNKMQARFTEKHRESVLSTVDLESRTIRVSWFRRYKFSQHGLTEAQRREQEFMVMRRIQKNAQSSRRWLSLAISATAAMALWLVGAAVFMVTERPQGWSYFVALYFSYTSLLTIGYGDFQPQSNSGKPFFVFWSLLAVPTLTILISNMGDTVIKLFSELTIWAGSLTILPGESDMKATFKAAATRILPGKVMKMNDFRVDKPPGILPHSAEDSGKPKMHSIEDHALQRLASHVEDEELDEALRAGQAGDSLQRDMHLYHFVLARELRQVMNDTQASPPKEYTYSEWAWYLKLLGQDEANADYHRKPPVEPRRRKLGRNPRAKVQLEQLGKADGKEGDLHWSWLGTRSPLMSNKSEAEWLLERLSRQLEREMARVRSANPDERNWAPPISFMDLKKHRKEQATGDPNAKAEADDTNLNEEIDAVKKDQ